MRMLHPVFLWNLARNFFASAKPPAPGGDHGATTTGTGALGTLFADGETIVREGDIGDCMYVIQAGVVEVTVERDGQETVLRRLQAGEVIGEMALLDRKVRSATVRAVGEARLVTVDRTTLLRRIHEDPSLAFNLVESMSRRIRQLSDEVQALRETAASREDRVAE